MININGKREITISKLALNEIQHADRHHRVCSVK